MLNPNQYSHTLGISYDQSTDQENNGVQKKPLGEVASETQFSAINPEEIKFELLFDNTGVANSPGQPAVAVKQRIDDLKDIVYRYVGDSETMLQNPLFYLLLLWNLAVMSLIFKRALEISTFVSAMIAFNFYVVYQFVLVLIYW